MKIILISPKKALLEEIRLALQTGSDQRVFYSFEGGIESLTKAAGSEQPNLVILDVSGLALSQMDLLDRFSLQHPDTVFILLRESVSPDFLMAAMHIGVKDVLPIPLIYDDLKQAVLRVEKKYSVASNPTKSGKVIVFASGKGGAGTTFLASNLAYMLAEEQEVSVALFDFNLQFGDALLFISNHVPLYTLADVASNISRLDASLLASSMVRIMPNFSVLAAPEEIERAAEVKPEHIDVLLKLAKKNYDYVIVDIDAMLNATSIKALDHADMIFVVLQETMPFIRSAKKMLTALQSIGFAKDKIKLLINRYEKRGDIELSDVETALGMKVFEVIPSSYDVVLASENQGLPILKVAKHDPVTKSLKVIAEELVDGHKLKATTWLSRLLQNS